MGRPGFPYRRSIHQSAPGDKCLAVMFAALPLLISLEGCGASAHIAPTAFQQAISSSSLQPSIASIQIGDSLQFSIGGTQSSDPCTWNTSTPSVLEDLGNGQFQAAQAGATVVSALCGASYATASVTVATQEPTGPIQITSGGIYSGNWTSDDPQTPAVAIQTDQPVTIRDSVITSRGPLIALSGVQTGANVTVENVTGTAIDPGVAGMQRGAFVSANNIASLIVRNCSMYGVSFGVYAASSSPSTIKIVNNYGSNLEDRASDGKGGLLAVRPELGHFIILNNIEAPGAEIAWNEVYQVIGQSSTEDVINIYGSQGTQTNPILIHDNYMEGYSSPATGHYDGGGVITDGNAVNAISAFVQIESNDILHTPGGGVSIANGHDISASGNRLVSCGYDDSSGWYATEDADAVAIFDYYNTGPNNFFNNSISSSIGGFVGEGTGGAPLIVDQYVNPLAATYPGIALGSSDFTDPCITNGRLNLQAENDEKTYWQQKVIAAGQLIGDQHSN